MDLSALLNMIPPPWNVVLLIALPIILHKLGIKVPFLPEPAKPNTPPEPVPVPVVIPNRPLLNSLLGVLASLRNIRDVTSEEKALAGAIGDTLKGVAGDQANAPEVITRSK